MKLSVVATLYRSAAYIAEFHQRITAVARALVGDNYEIILVNDGSPDDSLFIAQRIVQEDAHVKTLDLSRNFGHHRAMMCGIKYTAGDRVFLTDVDLEEPPELLSSFWSAMENEPEVDVIVGQLQKKTQPLLKKMVSDLFYLVFNKLSDIGISDRDIVSRLMKRPYVDALVAYREREIFFPAIWEDAGFRQKRVLATKTFDGNSSYTTRKRIAMAVEAITSFSSKPLLYIFYLGLLFSLGATLFIASLVIKKLFLDQPLPGWTSLMAVLFLIGGIIIFSLGVVGMYVSKIYTEVKARPISIVRKVYENAHQGDDLNATTSK